jgi:hypothetical protein
MPGLILLIISSWCIGCVLVKEDCFKMFCHPVRHVFRIAIGFGIWCIVLFTAGLFSAFSQTLIILVSLVIIALAGVILRKRQIVIFVQIPHLKIVEQALVCVIMFILLVTFLSSFAPVTGGIKNDEVHTHLSIPANWLRSGSFSPQSVYPLSYMAGNGELLFLYVMTLSREIGPHLVSWFSFLMMIVLVYGIARLELSRSISLAAAMVMSINPLIYRGASVAFVDTVAAVFPLGALLLYLAGRKENSTALIPWTFFVAAIGCGVKPTNFIYSGILILMIIRDHLHLLHRKQLYNGKNHVFLLILKSAVFFLPALIWPLRTLWFTGSPTFPPLPIFSESGLQERLCHGAIPYSHQEIESFYKYVLSRYGDYHRSIVNAVKYIWDLTMNPEKFQAGDSIGTAVLSLFPVGVILVFRRRNGTLLRVMVFSIAAAAGVYALILPEARYYIVSLSTASVIAVASLGINKTHRLVIWCTIIVLVVNMLFSSAVALRIRKNYIRQVFDANYRRSYQLAHTPFIEAFKLIQKNNGTEKIIVLYDNPIW